MVMAPIRDRVSRGDGDFTILDGTAMGEQPHEDASILHLQVESRMDRVSAALDTLHAFAEAHLQKEEAVYRAQLLFNEALTNALKHGNGFEAEKQITVDVKANGRAFTFSVEDEGIGFEPDSVESPIKERNLRRSHGRGLHLIEELADEVVFECDGRRLCVTIRP